MLVKYVTALLGPMLLWYAWQHTPGTPGERLRSLAPGLAAAVFLAVLCYAPFWEGRATFGTVTGEANAKMITSVPILLREKLAETMSSEDAARAAQQLARATFLVLYVPLLWQARRDFTGLVACGTNALFLYLVIATPWFRPWYFLWPLALAALLPGTWFTALFLTVSFFGSFPDLVEQYRYNVDWLAADFWRALAAPIAVQFGPPVAVWLAGLLRFRSWHFDAGGEETVGGDGAVNRRESWHANQRKL